MADEGAMQNSHVNKIDDVEVVSSKSIVFKLIELVAAIFAIGLLVDPFNSINQLMRYEPKIRLDDVAFVYITIAGFIIINTIFVIGHVLGDRMPKRTSLLFSVTGSILHVIAAIIIIVNWKKLGGNHGIYYNSNMYASKQYMDMLISACVFTFVNAVVFGCDVYFTIRKILVLAVFALTCQIITKDDSPYGRAESVAITALFGAFLVITLVDMISQCTGDPIPDTPMFLFGILGASFFVVAAIGSAIASSKNGVTAVWRFIIATIICVACAILFLLDVILIFLYGY